MIGEFSIPLDRKVVSLRRQLFPVFLGAVCYTACMSNFGWCFVVPSLLFHGLCVYISRIPSLLSVLIAMELYSNKFHYIRYIQR